MSPVDLIGTRDDSREDICGSCRAFLNGGIENGITRIFGASYAAVDVTAKRGSRCCIFIRRQYESHIATN